jgi:CheY-like chemotaxis protein
MGMMGPRMSKYHVRKLRSSYVAVRNRTLTCMLTCRQILESVNIVVGQTVSSIMATADCIDESPKIVSLRVLVVDDYEPFRHFVCSTLQKKTGLLVVGEAADGLEAVQMAERLRPNVIVLDIGLPIIDGIEAARRIRALSPLSKILFVSQESSPDIVQEALSLGSGYVIKTRAGIELLAAVEALRLGDRFIGNGLPGLSFTNSASSQRPNQL